MSTSLLPQPPQPAMHDDSLLHYPLDKVTKEYVFKGLRVKIQAERVIHGKQVSFLP